ncbi:MAG: phosphate regulon sensor histidine kinase PhoR [Betaproteobacteria bacterium]|nr:phosphate regulon sensor histidine kinase PhoR [Betaproteobacteria bacterium]
MSCVRDARQIAQLTSWLRHPETPVPKRLAPQWMELASHVLRQRRNHKDLLAQSDKRLADFLAALQVSPNGVVLIDADQRIEWFNQTAAEHFGFDARRDAQQHFTNLVRDPVVAAYFAARDFSHSVVFAGRSNTRSPAQRISLQLHLYGQGRSLLLSRDVTAIEQADAMRRDFVANVSHEIRTPLTVMGGFVETLQTLKLSGEEQTRYLDLMAQQAARMQSLVDDLLTLSKLEGSPRPSGHEWLKVETLIQACVDEARALSRLLWGNAQHIDIDLDTETSPEIAGSDTELHSALFNLVGNAVRYTPADKSIRVGWSLNAQGQGILAVTDHGLGIAPEHLPRLTERFYRVDRSRSRETGGTGLGLAIVKHVAQRHNAELQIESTPGKGSVFRLVFGAHRVRATVEPSAALVDQD